MFDEMSASHFKRKNNTWPKPENTNNEGGIRSPLDGLLSLMRESYIHSWSIRASFSHES